MAEKKQTDDFRYLVRIQNTDLEGKKNIIYGLKKIKGVGLIYANMIVNLSKIDKTKKVGYLTDEDVKKLEDVILNPKKYNIPAWMFNRRKDYETGEDKHILNADLEFTQNNDKRRMQKIKSYRGLRLSWNLTVRGQSTKANFRRSKGKGLGVKKKK
ncbi:MAG: 30S ribosomal protein S13 [Candidatus Woesearchaeota archaeon]